MNNHSVPDWNFESDLPVSNQKRILGQDNELVELLWQNGQVVLRSQTHKSHMPIQRNDQATLRGGNGNFSFANSTNLIHDDETVSWIRYPSEDYLEREFCSNLLSELQQSDPMEADNNKPNRQSEHHQHQQPQFVKSSFATATAAASCPATLVYNMAANSQQLNVSSQSQPPEFRENPMPPPKFQFDSAQQNKKSEGLSKIPVFSPVAAGHTVLKNNGGNLIQKEAKECSGMTVGSSFCGSNQVRNDNDFSRGSSNAFGTTATGFSAGTSKEDVQKKAIVLNERGKAETMEPTLTLTSSSGGSGSSFDKTCKQPPGVISSHKRKSRDGEEFECQSEAAELQSAAGNKPAQRPGTGRRSRAAEVHNLSERRRRDRINEKMRALQELIPHCNKTDKASMLDEAIEYLKSLQLQLQVMWMGNGMAPMMFPGIQHYMSRMGMGMGMGVGVGLGMGPPPGPLPSVHNPMHLSRVPVVDPSMSTSSMAAPSQNQTPTTTCQIQQLNPVSVNYQQHFQTPTFPEQYARFLGFHHMQTASQPVNMFGYGTQTAQQNPVLSLPSNSNITFNGGAALTNNTSQSGKMG